MDGQFPKFLIYSELYCTMRNLQKESKSCKLSQMECYMRFPFHRIKIEVTRDLYHLIMLYGLARPCFGADVINFDTHARIENCQNER